MKAIFFTLAMVGMLAIASSGHAQQTTTNYRVSLVPGEGLVIQCMVNDCVIKEIGVDRGRKKGKLPIFIGRETHILNFGEAAGEGYANFYQLELGTSCVVLTQCSGIPDSTTALLLLDPSINSSLIKKFCTEELDAVRLRMKFSDRITIPLSLRDTILEVNINDGEAIYHF